MQDQETTSAAAALAKPFLRTYNEITLKRIESIEEIPLAHDEAMEGIHKAMHRDYPTDMRPPGDNTVFYRYSGGKYIISSWERRKLEKSIIDNKCIHNGVVTPLHDE